MSQTMVRKKTEPMYNQREAEAVLKQVMVLLKDLKVSGRAGIYLDSNVGKVSTISWELKSVNAVK